jgi:hypothetical protein
LRVRKEAKYGQKEDWKKFIFGEPGEGKAVRLQKGNIIVPQIISQLIKPD